jgi:hypothetical protein
MLSEFCSYYLAMGLSGSIAHHIAAHFYESDAIQVTLCCADLSSVFDHAIIVGFTKKKKRKKNVKDK